jgi:opacity protein-like surface antigen
MLACAACATPVPDARAAGAPTPRGPRADPGYTLVKAGVFRPGGDLRDLDEGQCASFVLGRDLGPSTAVELEAGYLAAEGPFRGHDFELWALPVFVNWRFRAPIPFVQPYAGAGLGFLYADYEAIGAFATTEYLFAWNAFGGFEVAVGRFAVGAEYRYVQAEESDETSEWFTIEGQSLGAYLSLRF